MNVAGQRGSATEGTGTSLTILRFAGVGLVTTLLDVVLFATLVAVGSDPAVANVLSYSCGIALSYGLNRRWTFRMAGSRRQAAKFVVSTLTGLAISTMLVTMLCWHLPTLVAKVVTLPVVFVWNFGTARLWVFARKVPSR